MRIILNEFLFENMSTQNGIKYIPIDYNDFDDDYEEEGLDIYDMGEKADAIARNSGVRILSDKDLSGVLYDTNKKMVVGGLWTSEGMDEFSFDIAIDKEYRGKGLSHILIRNAFEIYNDLNGMYGDMNDENLPIEIDVINPMLANILKNTYGLKVLKRIDRDRVIMG